MDAFEWMTIYILILGHSSLALVIWIKYLHFLWIWLMNFILYNFIVQKIHYWKGCSVDDLSGFDKSPFSVLFWCRFRNLIERVLRARLVYGNPNMNRAVSFEYMNRQLVWNEFSVTIINSQYLWAFDLLDLHAV